MKKETKSVYVCDYCGSDNIQSKAWVNPNKNTIDDYCPGELDYCKDCHLHTSTHLVKLKASAKVIGFQVVGIDGTDSEGQTHPDMQPDINMYGKSCLYNIYQADEMIRTDSDKWRLLSVWSGDIKKPTYLFMTKNPRKF
jgi:hypothetical protein